MHRRSSSGIRAYLLLTSLVISGLIIAFALTSVAWMIQIEDRALHCTDGGFAGFVVDIETHRQAGDTLGPGWTWETLKVIRAAYIVASMFIWLIIIVAPIVSILKSADRTRMPPVNFALH